MGFHPDWPEIAEWIGRSSQILVKKLSRNDCSWADDPDKHQAGFYVPTSIREANFFPRFSGGRLDKPHIYENYFSVYWPASSEICRVRNVHYSNKGPESHLTLVPENQFSKLSPASLLVVGRLESPIELDADGVVLLSTRIKRKLLPPTEPARYWCVVADSISREAETIESVFSLTADFHFGLFSPEVLIAAVSDEERLISELSTALREGTLDRYIARQRLPDPSDLARQAQESWLRESGAPSLDPFALQAPGDAVMRISRDVEFALYKQAELRQRASQVAGLLLRGGDIVTSLVRRFGALDQLFLSASQTRKSRAGLSFEYHVKRLLVDGRVRHEAQVVFGGRRPDFVLPDVVALNDTNRTDALILSLKTTLRERWKQLGLERKHGAVFLATVDDRVSAPAIDEMARNDIVLVVPESLKKSKEACYSDNAAVITFHDFFHDQIGQRRPALILA